MEKDKATELHARVFISCGQSKNTEEVLIAAKIKQMLLDLGFDPYVAVEEQTLRGLKENLFEQLAKSEYFVFVDFKREPLGGDLHRGSLFCHQELAIASYLDIPVLAVQEDGVKSDDGILRIIQANVIPFTDRNLLPDLIGSEIRRTERDWKAGWRNELALVISVF